MKPPSPAASSNPTPEASPVDPDTLPVSSDTEGDVRLAERAVFVRGALLMSACLAFFTANALLIRYAGTRHAIDTWSLVFLRGLIGLLFVFLWYGRGTALHTRRVFTRPALVARGIVGTVGLIAYYWTIPRLGAGVATFLSNTYVVFGAVFAACFLVRENLTVSRLLGLLLSLAGVALLTDIRAGFDPAFAVALLGAVAAGWVIVIIRFLHRTEATPTIFMAQCVYAILAVAPLALAKLPALNLTQWGWACLAALMATFGQLTMTQAFRYLSVAAGGAFHLTIPVWIALGGFLLFDERFTTLQIAGATLILLGCLQALRSGPAARAIKVPAPVPQR